MTEEAQPDAPESADPAEDPRPLTIVIDYNGVHYDEPLFAVDRVRLEGLTGLSNHKRNNQDEWGLMALYQLAWIVLRRIKADVPDEFDAFLDGLPEARTGGGTSEGKASDREVTTSS